MNAIPINKHDDQAVFSSQTIKPKETDDEIIERLASFKLLDYDRCRESEAEVLGVRVSILDKMVNQQRVQGSDKQVIEKLEPHHSPVNLNDVLTHIESEILRYAVLPDGASSAISLWIAGAYALNQFRIFPKLVVFSPEKRCGKSTVLDLVESFSHKALFASSISQAAIYRVIEAYQPTLIIDEADTFISGRNDEMVGIINSGHAKNRAFVVRSEGDNHTPTKFSTWAPMVLASIKELQGTIMDRGVCIELRRKMNHEKTVRIPANLAQLNREVREKLIRWALDNEQTVRENHIEPPPIGNDRAIDNWMPLFTVAELAGGEWPTKIMTSYTLLNSREEELTPPVMLLEDIKGILSKHTEEKMPSSLLVDKLLELEERPWREWRNGQPMTQNSLAKMLKGFGIRSKSINYLGKIVRGFQVVMFNDAFSRYLAE